MGLFSRLFGSSKPPQKQPDPEQYKGFQIYPASLAEGGQYRVAGKISKEIAGEIKTHSFIRSDVLPSQTDADQLMVKKAQMLIDQMGEKIF